MNQLDERVAEGALSLCTLQTGEDTFGIATHAVREALYRCDVRHVPLAPAFVAGVLAYRGEVLLAVSFRSLLGLASREGPSCAIVLKDEESGELFALLIDTLLDVISVTTNSWEPNPATLDERRSLLFSGIHRRPNGALVRLQPEKLQPTWLLRNLGTQQGLGSKP